MSLDGFPRTTKPDNPAVQLLQAARDLVGGEDRLAERLNMSRMLLRCYLAGRNELPYCDWAEMVCAYAMQTLPSSEVAAVETHIYSCTRCQRELEALRPVLDTFVSWPTDVLRPVTPLQARLAERIAADTGGEPVMPAGPQWCEPEWEEVAPGIHCKLLAADEDRHRVSMLVRLAAGAAYPPHTHSGVEELHLLDGELWIDDSRAALGTSDKRVWSETGCTCVLITSTKDVLR